MPPRHVYWTIIVGGQPTAFRAAAVEELLPTFNRLKQKHPDAVIKWFERGRLWDSRGEARHLLREGHQVWRGGRLSPPPRAGDTGSSAEESDRRGPGWRPGGLHRDPREKYTLAKKAKWKRFKEKIRERQAQNNLADRDRRRAAAPQAPGAPKPAPGRSRRGFRNKGFASGHTARRRETGRKPPKPRGGR